MTLTSLNALLNGRLVLISKYPLLSMDSQENISKNRLVGWLVVLGLTAL